DGKMYIRLEAGAVEKHIIETNRFWQAECRRRGGLAAIAWRGRGEQGGELPVDGAQALLADPFAEPVAGTLGKYFDRINLPEIKKPLQQRAVGKPGAEAAVVEAC